MDWNNRAYGLAPLKEAAHLSGLEVMRKIATGEFPDPPICKQLTFRLAEVGEGFAVFEGETGPHLLNPLGGVHGGWALTRTARRRLWFSTRSAEAALWP